MTICEKFKLMMASFADIKAAIAEKGGVDVPDDTPFSEYGDKIRQIQLFEITTNLIKFRQNEKFSIQMEAVGGKPPYKWEHSGYAPKGMNFSEDGLLSGIVKPVEAQHIHKRLDSDR